MKIRSGKLYCTIVWKYGVSCANYVLNPVEFSDNLLIAPDKKLFHIVLLFKYFK